MQWIHLIILTTLSQSYAFSALSTATGRFHPASSIRLSSEKSEWNGEVVSNTVDGKIRGCSLTRVDGTLTEWTIAIDGVEADLSSFSEAIYKKITSDAKKQRFQGFRPGTIPPHLIPTYVAFTMDECARETTLEAMQQNDIRPFDDARDNFEFSQISIERPKKSSKSKKGKKKKNEPVSENVNDAGESESSRWIVFDTMKDAISAGWKPGQSFSFVASNVKGQQLSNQDVTVTNPIGGGRSIIS
jgi:hypothetical protein